MHEHIISNIISRHFIDSTSLSSSLIKTKTSAIPPVTSSINYTTVSSTVITTTTVSEGRNPCYEHIIVSIKTF